MPVTGQHRHLLRRGLDHHGLLQDFGHGPVQAHLAAGVELGDERLPEEGVGERVVVEGLGGGDDPGGQRLVDRVEGHVLQQPGDLGRHPDRERRVEQGADRQQRVRVGRELRETPAEHLPDPLGDHVGEIVGRDPCAVLEPQRTRLAQVQEQLAEEERVAVRLAGEQHGELLRHRLPGHLFEERVHVLDGQAREGESRRLDLATQHGQRLGQRVAPVEVGVPVGAHHQQARPQGPPRHRPQEPDGGVIGPVEVVEHEHDRRRLAEAADHLRDGVVHPGSRVRRREVGRLAERDDPVQRGHDAAEHGAVRPERVLHLGGGGLARPPGEGLREGPVGRGLTVMAPAGEHDRRRVGRLGRGARFRHQAGLADARLAGHQDEPAGTGRGRGDPIGEQRAFPLAADVGRAGPKVAAPLERRPGDGDGLDRVGQALQLQRPDGRQLVAAPTPSEHPHDVGGEDLPARRCAAQPGRLDHGHAEGVAVLDGDVARRQADPDGERLPLLAGQDVDALLQRDAGGHRRGGAGERGEGAVAQPLDERAAVLGDHVGDEAVEAPTQVLGGVLTQRGAQLGGPDQVDHEDRRRLRPHAHLPVRPGRG